MVHLFCLVCNIKFILVGGTILVYGPGPLVPSFSPDLNKMSHTTKFIITVTAPAVTH